MGTHCAFAVGKDGDPRRSMARSAARVRQADSVSPELATIENGLVFLEEALGSPIHLAELITFPAARDDDQVNSTAEKVGPI